MPDAVYISSTLVWLVLELVVIYLTLTVMSINTTLTKWDIVSFSGLPTDSIFFSLLFETRTPFIRKDIVLFCSSLVWDPCRAVSAKTTPFKGPQPRLARCFWKLGDTRTLSDVGQ